MLNEIISHKDTENTEIQFTPCLRDSVAIELMEI